MNKPLILKKRKQSKEQTLQKAILAYLKAKGYFVWKNSTTGVYDPLKRAWRTNRGQRGVSDILGLTKKGRFLAIEVKIKPNKTSPEQVEFLWSVEKSKGFGLVAYCLDDVINYITNFIEKTT